ncbi:hypothetical protein [Moraxella bovis]|uniref:Uncharacterized protein n=1 Tax=Moraxella bovis TaxID=476 RepID=A0ABY6M5W1_MORBO|nr:hypothetical protein [Moraxella bovis]UZA02942.1 hypothetical protein LP092_13555 [Moraxella bovis]UZA54035.1 hypothetical protein LP111_12770 [Moraxella bovis]UZA57359.1 hypothetical protein LP127_01405 [Moraxella bovis]
MLNRKLPDLEAKNILKSRLSEFIKAHRNGKLSDEAMALLITDLIPCELKDTQTILTQVINSQYQVISILSDDKDKQRFYQYIQDCIDKNYEPSADIIEQWGEMRDAYFHIENRE